MTHCPEFAFALIRVDKTDSTSNYLQNLTLTSKPEEFTTVLADFQTSGKGQRGNGWESEAGRNLLFSTITYPGFLEVRKQFMLSKAIALSIKETLDEFGESFSIKWPNDIYWKDKKICGTLIENDIQGTRIVQSIAGIGVNINQQIFLSEAPNPVSLVNITHREHDPLPILCSIMKRIVVNLEALKEGNEEEISRRYHQSLYRKDGFYWYEDKDGRFEGEIQEVLPTGVLVLRDKSGNTREYAFKEVRYRYGYKIE